MFYVNLRTYLEILTIKIFLVRKCNIKDSLGLLSYFYYSPAFREDFRNKCYRIGEHFLYLDQYKYLNRHTHPMFAHASTVYSDIGSEVMMNSVTSYPTAV